MFHHESQFEYKFTQLLPGDRIDITREGAVTILRGAVPLLFFLQPGVSPHYFKIFHSPGQIVNHEYAWWMARALAGIAGLHVVDSYEPSKEGYHSFPVTDTPPGS